MSAEMKVAVLGGTGFIGSRFVKDYADKFAEVKVVCRTPDRVVKISESSNVFFVQAHCEDVSSIKLAIAGSDIVVNLIHDNKDLDNNISIAYTLAKSISETPSVKLLIHFSSFSVFDPNTVGEMTEESKFLDSNEPYGVSKLAVQRVLEENISSNKNVLVLLPTIVYGDGGNWNRHATSVASTFGKMVLPFSGDGICNVVHVSDVCSAIHLATRNFSRELFGESNYMAMIVSGQSIKWKDFYKAHQPKGLPAIEFLALKGPGQLHSNRLIAGCIRLIFGICGNHIYRLKSKLRSSNQATKEDPPQNQERAWEPKLYARLVHSSRFTISSSKAERLLKYIPKRHFTLNR